MSKIFSGLCTLLLLVAFTPSTTHADPILITSGTLTVTGFSGPVVYGVSGDNFSAGGTGELGSVPLLNSCHDCLSGSVVNVFAFFGGSSLGGNHAGAFTFTGPPITIPFSLTTLTLTSPFQFTGNLITCPQSCFIGPAISNVSLVGSGTATFELLFNGVIPDGRSRFTFHHYLQF